MICFVACAITRRKHSDLQVLLIEDDILISIPAFSAKSECNFCDAAKTETAEAPNNAYAALLPS